MNIVHSHLLAQFPESVRCIYVCYQAIHANVYHNKIVGATSNAFMPAGVAYFGTMGTADALTDISAIGNEVNLAARLVPKAATGEILLSEQALKEASIDGSELESRILVLKGITEPVIARVMHGS